MVTTPPCVTSRSTTPTVVICAPSAWTDCGFRRGTASGTTISASGLARIYPRGLLKERPVNSTEFPKYKDPRLNALAPSLVAVTFDMPYSVSGITERNYHGTGLVVDAERGLVVVDRNTVPVSIGNVTITFAGTVEVPGRVVYIHPVHNLAVVAYDPKLIGATPVKSAKLTPR